jgi:TRAP-type C4-dicarboxylate transport system substrate-binding protein
MRRLLMTSTLLLISVGGPAPGRAAPVTLKVATVMPSGGPWANAMSRFAAQVRRQTGGQVVFKIYFGAVAGTEQRAMSRMKAGQIQGLAVANAALSSIDGSIRVLELPMLYRSYKEFRFVLKSMAPIFRKRYEKHGYRLLAMASVGWVYLYSKKPIRSLADIRRCKIWRWKHDPMATALFKIMGMSGHRLPVTDVLASLQAGTIDTVYGMPHSTQALQWHTSVKYVVDFKITMAIGAVVMRNDAFTRLTPKQQKIVEEQARTMQRALNQSSASINAKAMRAMRRGGLQLLKPSTTFHQQLIGLKGKLMRRLRNIMYRPADLKKVRALLSLCRVTSCSS